MTLADVERLLAGLTVLHPDAVDLVADDVADPTCRAVVRAALRLHRNGRPVDLLTVTDAVAGICSASTVVDLLIAYATAPQRASDLTRAVRDAARLRAAHRFGALLTGATSADAVDALLADMRAALEVAA